MKFTFFANSFFLFLALFLYNGLQAQQEWLIPGQKSTSTLYRYDKSRAVAVDESGSVYTTGISENNNNQYNNWAWEIPVKKYSPYGGRVFAAHKNLVPSTWSSQDEAGFAIGASAKHDRVIVGGYKHIWYFPFLAFFSASSGAYIAEIPFNYCNGAILNMDVVGDAVYVIGSFNGTLSFGYNLPVLTSVPAKKNIFIAKFDIASRTLQRVFQVYGDGLMAKDIKADESGNIYFTAITSGMVQFIGVTGVYVPTASGQREAFICSVTSAGVVHWAKPASPTFSDPNFNRNFPIGMSVGDESATIVVGGNDANTGSAYIRKYNAGNGASLGQSPAFTGKVINDLTVATCGIHRIYAVGNEVLSNGAPGFGFMFEFFLNDFNNGGYHYTNDPAIINGVAVDKLGHPAIAGETPSYINSFSFRGKTVAQTNSHEFAGKFKANNSCCPNRGLSLDGVNDFAELTFPPDVANYTLEAWAQSTATNTGACNGEFRTLAAWKNFGKYAIEVGECAGNLAIKYYYPSAFSSTIKMEFSSNHNTGRMASYCCYFRWKQS
ncbi:MAG: hypothetical protein JNJ57_21350 [Saprospiraceae bacterium]|nr:hypothetical protein [Saprospiraceae bacterium]